MSTIAVLDNIISFDGITKTTINKYTYQNTISHIFNSKKHIL